MAPEMLMTAVCVFIIRLAMRGPLGGITFGWSLRLGEACSFKRVKFRMRAQAMHVVQCVCVCARLCLHSLSYV